MQDEYAGDVGDFGKYGLLNEIYKESKETIKLGINWYYNVPGNKSKKGDGRYTDYLKNENKHSEKYKKCFPELYKKLKNIVYDSNGQINEERRKIKEIENSDILPKSTVFYSEPLKGEREKWFEESLKRLYKTDIILLDPDNGIQTDKIKKTQKKALKYVFKDEIEKYYETGKSLIIYNHRDRKKESKYKEKINSINKSFDAEIKVLRFKRISVRDFIFLIQKPHRDLIYHTIINLEKEPYNFLFKLYELNQENVFSEGKHDPNSRSRI